MKKVSLIIFAGIMAAGLASCSASDDELTGITSRSEVAAPTFSLLSYSQSESTPVPTDTTTTAQDEKLVCKVLRNGQLQLTHKNVVFDDATNIQLETSLDGKQLTIVESGSYGHSGNYSYYTLTATVGTLLDGDYTIVVKRNDNVRAMFKMTYDSSKAK